MHQTLRLKLTIFGFTVFVMCLLAVSTFSNQATASGVTSGWAWSSTIGWVGLYNTSYFNVDTLFNGTNYHLDGYAWGNNVGWVRFGGLSGCPAPNPVDGTCDPVVDQATGELTGWARACSVFASGCSGALRSNSARGNWDGWISFNCANTGTCATSDYKWQITSGNLNGFAWGGDVISWLQIGNVPVSAPAPTVTLEIRTVGSGAPFSAVTAYDILDGQEIELRWDSVGAISCSGLVTGSGGNFNVAPLTAGTDSDVLEPTVGMSGTFQVICDGLGAQSSASIVVNTISNRVYLDVDKNPVELNDTVVFTWDVVGNDPNACVIEGPNGYATSLIDESSGLMATSGSLTSPAILGESDFILDCIPNGINPGADDTETVFISGNLFET